MVWGVRSIRDKMQSVEVWYQYTLIMHICIERWVDVMEIATFKQIHIATNICNDQALHEQCPCSSPRDSHPAPFAIHMHRKEQAQTRGIHSSAMQTKPHMYHVSYLISVWRWPDPAKRNHQHSPHPLSHPVRGSSSFLLPMSQISLLCWQTLNDVFSVLVMSAFLIWNALAWSICTCQLEGGHHNNSEVSVYLILLHREH